MQHAVKCETQIN